MTHAPPLSALPPTPTARPPRRRASRPAVLLLTLLAVVLGGCTFSSGKHIEVDFLGAKYRFSIYEKPSAMLAVELRDLCKAKRGPDRRSWARCSLEFLHDQVTVPSLAKNEWKTFTSYDQWDDYGGAVDAIVAAGFGFDRSNERYARRCLVGDHTAFRDYNWTTRADSDAHCKRGTRVMK